MKLYNPTKIHVHTYMGYIKKILSRYSKSLEDFILSKTLHTRSSSPKITRNFKIHEELFTIRAYILGSSVKALSGYGIEVPIRIATNASILISNNKVWLYLRCSSLGSHPIPNPWSRTFITTSTLTIEELRSKLELLAKPILYPLLPIERVEDPRIHVSNASWELYHVRFFEPYSKIGSAKSYVLTFKASISKGSTVNYIEPIVFRDPTSYDEVIIRSYRDTFPLNKSFMVLRPWFEDIKFGFIAIAPREDNIVLVEDLRVYPELMPMDDELKVGSNCVVKISSNEYLLIFHSVDKVFGTYHTYAALLNSDGELLGLTPEPILSPMPHTYFGARPSTIFVCGAAILKDKLILSAGKDDEITLILEADLDKVMSKIKYIKP